jgi:hypothetical protein
MPRSEQDRAEWVATLAERSGSSRVGSNTNDMKLRVGSFIRVRGQSLGSSMQPAAAKVGSIFAVTMTFAGR